MIKLELEVTPEQMRDIADVLDGCPLKVCDNCATVFEAEADISKSQLMNDVNKEIDTKRAMFNAYWTDMIATGNADEFGSAEYIRCYDEWFESDCAELTVPNCQEAANNGDADIPKPPAAADTANSAEVPAPSVNTAELDSAGLPWDARIHGKAKKQNADKTWKYTKGVDKEVLVPQVEAELRKALAAVPAPDATVDAGSLFAESDAQQAAVPTPVETVPTPPAAKAGPTTFQELLPLVTAAKNAKTLTQEKIDEVAQELGLVKFGLIATSQDPTIFGRAAQLLGV